MSPAACSVIVWFALFSADEGKSRVGRVLTCGRVGVRTVVGTAAQNTVTRTHVGSYFILKALKDSLKDLSALSVTQ